MNPHLSRPLLAELEELYGIAVKEHGPDGHSSRVIARALAQVREQGGRNPVPPAFARYRPGSETTPDARASAA